MNPLFSYIKIVSVLVLSYIIVSLFSGVFFIGNSPSLRPHPEQYLAIQMKGKVNTLIAGLGFGGKKNSGITTEDYKMFISTTAAKGMKQIAPGTYAATINGEEYQIVKTGELPTQETTQTISGQEIKITTIGANPPNQAQLQNAMDKFSEYRKLHGK